jgi:ribosomal protein S18 acetylase RimI-like enzyme
LSSLRLRDARPGDKDAVLEFCRNTWSGYGDFIPRAWGSWIRQRRGRFILAEIDKVPVGIAKITDFGAGEIWLEGLRVHPGYRHRGIADAINTEVARTLSKMKPGHVRFCTAQVNRGSRRIGEKYGFKIAARFRNYWVKPRRGTPRGEFAGPDRAREIYEFIVASRFMRLSSGLVGEGWIFREFSRSLLRGYLQARRVMVLETAGRLRGVGIYPPEAYDDCVNLCFVDGDDRAITILARNCFYLAAAEGLPYCSVSVPSRRFPGLIELAGYKRKESIGQVIFQHAGSGLRIRRSGRSR